ncbi:MAG: nucleotide exchange factor GrpE [bacterium]|nr:nucleotide exchange factor GrpE [bacterium]
MNQPTNPKNPNQSSNQPATAEVDPTLKTETVATLEMEQPEVIGETPNLGSENVGAVVDNVQDDLAEVQDRYIRLAAEFENYKKRSEREKQSAVKYASEGLLHELLPIIDNLEQALTAAKNYSSSSNDKANQNMVTGLTMVLKQFQDVLSRFGITSFSALGQVFDPLKHEAVSEKETNDSKPGQVVEEYQKGYLLNDRLVRAARVVVAKAPTVIN